MRTEFPAYLIAALIVIAATVLLVTHNQVPAEFYGALFGALGIAGGVSIPNKTVSPPTTPTPGVNNG